MRERSWIAIGLALIPAVAVPVAAVAIGLAAMFGVVLGWQLTLLTIMLAAFAGTVWGGLLIARGQGGARTALPFGTLLAPAALVAFLWGPAILHGYARLFR